MNSASLTRSCVGLLMVMVLPVFSHASPKKKTFNATPDRVYSAALKVIAQHHKVQFTNKDERIISFHTGTSLSSWGFECNAKVEQGDEPGQAILVINVQKTHKQLFAWGGGERLADDIFKWAEEEIAESQYSGGTESSDRGKDSFVTITSLPPGAEIYVETNFIGNTPSTLKLPSGKHVVFVKKQGFKDWVREITFSGGTISLVAELLPGSNEPAGTSAMAPATTKPAARTTVMVSSPQQTKNSIPPTVSSPPGWIGLYTTRADDGALVTMVVPDGPAAKVGIRVGDVIQGVNGKNLGRENLDACIANFKPGTTVLISYMRGAWASDKLVTIGVSPTDSR